MGAPRDGVWIAEEDDGTFLTGRFRASWQTWQGEREAAEGLPAEEAVAWGRARSAWVMIRLGVGDYRWAGAGVAPNGVEPWPGGDVERRRHPDLAYLDRTEADPEIAWAVELWVAGSEEEVAAAAEAAGAEWDSESRDELLRDRERAGPGERGWMSYGRDAYRLRLCVTASTAGEARERAIARVALPDELGLEEATAEPV